MLSGLVQEDDGHKSGNEAITYAFKRVRAHAKY